MDMNKNELKDRLKKSIDFLKSEISNIRTGRAHPSIIEGIKIDAYGAKMSIKEVGSIVLLDSQTIMVSPWDKTLIPIILKAIKESDLKLNPSQDLEVIRVPIPPLTEERRLELTKLVSAKAEDTRQSLRNIRQDFMKLIDKDFSEKLIGEDEKFTKKDEVEKIVKEFLSETESITQAKNKELMNI